MVALIVDVQYYPVDGKHAIKEATILPLCSNLHSHFVFCNTPRFCELAATDRKISRFINEELGVIHHNFGVDFLQSFLDHIPYEALVLVNGHIKKRILKSLLPNNRIIDLKVPFNSLTSLRKCTFPSYHTQCSLTNCYKIKSYLS